MESSYPLRPGEPDCRDYLRTGRCKYGESCKYNHPANVEVGGGVKPTNPGEPMFPVRPTEPPCQYFLKHGTCKFGQSCKFNHPSGAAGMDGMQAINNTGLPSGLVFLTTNNNPSTYTINSSGGLRHSGSLGEVTSLSTTSSNVQILPQRPNEQNCIYFLRNGRCKYGPTCKFHHPIETATRVDRARSNSFSGYGQTPRLQPITEQVGATQKATHILLPDGQIAVIIDPSSLQQQMNEINVQPKIYMSPNGSLQTLHSTDQNQMGLSPVMTATTTSSATISSSFQSESTINIDNWGNKIPNIRTHGHSFGVVGSRNESGSNLSAYGSDESIPSAPQVQHQQYTQGQINYMQRQPYQIEISQSQHYQQQANVVQHPNDVYGYEDQRRRTASVGSYVEPSNSYMSSGSLSLSAQIAQDRRTNSPYRPSQSNSRVHGGNGHERGESSDGLTEMTSALLTMMDRHDSFDDFRPQASQSLSPGPDRRADPSTQTDPSHLSPTSSRPDLASQASFHYLSSEPFIHNEPTNSPARSRPPPGMTSLQQVVREGGSFEDSRVRYRSQSDLRPPQGGNYMQPSMSSAWGGNENAPRF